MLYQHVGGEAIDTKKPKPRGPRARGSVRRAMVEAGVSLARDGGPEAVVLREVTRIVGVVPNAAYRHFADREALLAAVRDEALTKLAGQMADGMDQITAGPRTQQGARQRLRAVGEAYLAFAREEPGLFDTAFAAAHPAPSADGESGHRIPFEHLQAALSNLVDAGVIPPERRPVIEYPIWGAVHGIATLLRGPLRLRSDPEKRKLESQALDFIAASI